MNAATAPAIPTAAPGPSLEALLAELLHLSPDKKIAVIARLAQSLQEEAVVEAPIHASVPAFVGAWADDPEANEMENAILSIRQPASEPELK